MYKSYKFSPGAIFNMDKSCLSTVPKKVYKVVCHYQGKETIGKFCLKKEVKTDCWVAVSMSGFCVPPTVVFAKG
jgi:hypothetical protein